MSVHLLPQRVFNKSLVSHHITNEYGMMSAMVMLLALCESFLLRKDCSPLPAFLRVRTEGLGLMEGIRLWKKSLTPLCLSSLAGHFTRDGTVCYSQYPREVD